MKLFSNMYKIELFFPQTEESSRHTLWKEKERSPGCEDKHSEKWKSLISLAGRPDFELINSWTQGLKTFKSYGSEKQNAPFSPCMPTCYVGLQLLIVLLFYRNYKYGSIFILIICIYKIKCLFVSVLLYHMTETVRFHHV